MWRTVLNGRTVICRQSIQHLYKEGSNRDTKEQDGNNDGDNKEGFFRSSFLEDNCFATKGIANAGAFVL